MRTFLMIVQFIVSGGLIAAVLLQDSKGEGFGSIGGGSTMFFNQAKGTAKLLEKATTYLAVVFLILSIVISVFV